MTVVGVSVRHTITDYGDAGLLVSMSGRGADERWAAAQSLADSLWSLRPEGLVDLVASYADVFVAFDPLVTDHARMRAAVQGAAFTYTVRGTSRSFVVPVVYGGEHGPDLPAVADELGISTAECVADHTARPWMVRFCGAPVGAPLMEGGRTRASVARRAEPRTRVAPGSVAVSGRQSVIYPVASPGGWRLIGQTPVRLTDASRDPIVPYRPGDTLRFVAIDESDWSRWNGDLTDLAAAYPPEQSSRA
jgi:KipI family sensor histidine kinase inhibitor